MMRARLFVWRRGVQTKTWVHDAWFKSPRRRDLYRRVKRSVRRLRRFVGKLVQYTVKLAMIAGYAGVVGFVAGVVWNYFNFGFEIAGWLFG